MDELHSDLCLLELDADTFQLAAEYYPFYKAYNDNLELLHDLLCEFREPPKTPIITTTAEIDEEYNGWLMALIGNARILHDPDKLLGNIMDNYALAWKIRNEIMNSKTAEERLLAKSAATKFLNSVEQVYNTLQTLKQKNDSEEN
ncbi:MAG TPA: hypothetical protein VHD90_00910 [Phototrophicaceae bacterium]|nr:hypothetical protein [Phototrophicaceae bacterium]